MCELGFRALKGQEARLVLVLVWEGQHHGGDARLPSSPGVSQASDQVSQGWKLDGHALDTQRQSISAQGEEDRLRVTGAGRFYCGSGRKGLHGAGGA